jgi:hypothetical protein
MSEEIAIVQRLFTRAAMRIGSATVLARRLGISYPDVHAYMYGEAMPPEDVLLRATELILEDLALIKAHSSADAWRRLFGNQNNLGDRCR